MLCHDRQFTDTALIIIVVDFFCITLFSALKRTPCIRVVCDSERVTVSSFLNFIMHLFIFTEVRTDSAVWLLHGWCNVKLLLSH